MDLFDTIYRWDEALVPALLDADRWLLLSERDAWQYDDPGFTGVVTAIEKGVPLAGLGYDEAWTARLPLALQALYVLAAQGHVRPVGEARQDEARFAAPNIMAEPKRLVASAHIDLVNLSGAVADSAALAFARGVEASAVTIVLCDDLLDPRLESVDREQCAVGRDWLLVKPTGSPRLAVLLRGGGAWNGACWHCLAQRFLHNRPVRGWWQAKRGAWPRVPVRCEPQWVAAGLRAVQDCTPRLLAQRVPQVLVFDDSGAPGAHAVVPRPDCRICSGSGRMAHRQWQPPAFDLGAPIERVEPLTTVERLRPYVSELCGIISHLTRLDPSHEPDAPAVYRSGFFKTPLLDGVPFGSPLAQLCLGKGMTEAQSQASALSEALERYAAYYQGDEACVAAAADALDALALLPQQLQPAAAPVDRATPMRWAPAWSLTRNVRCYLPLGFCYAHVPAEDADRIGWNSNGCAAGNTVEEAILRGFLELVERDAVAVWWYNRIVRPGVPISAGAARIGRAVAPVWERWLLDLTHDLGIPVVAAAARHRGTGDWAYGFGCGATRADAGDGAMAELLQLVSVDKRMAPPPAAGGDAAPRFLYPSESVARCEATRTIERVEDCVAAASAQGLEMIVLDYSRSDIPLHTVKVVVPGLNHIWPAWTTPRLRQVPVALGWQERPLALDELNPQALFL
jgi:bacteriocin biosynthesis cyclodehydratase domain-containing protein